MAITQGDAGNGVPENIRSYSGRLGVDTGDDDDLLKVLVTEMRAVRIGLELMNNMAPGDLLGLAEKG